MILHFNSMDLFYVDVMHSHQAFSCQRRGYVYSWHYYVYSRCCHEAWFGSLQTVEQHPPPPPMDLSTNNLTPALECRSCSKTFSQQNALSYHQRTCLSTINELRSALEKTKNGWANKRAAKRRKLEHVDSNAVEMGVAGNAAMATLVPADRRRDAVTYPQTGELTVRLTIFPAKALKLKK